MKEIQYDEMVENKNYLAISGSLTNDPIYSTVSSTKSGLVEYVSMSECDICCSDTGDSYIDAHWMLSVSDVKFYEL